MLALKLELIVESLYRAPKLGVKVNILVIGFKLTVGNALGEGVKVAACDKVDACSAEDIGGKVGKALCPGCGDLLDISAVLGLKKLQRKGLCVARSGSVERVIEGEPLDSLVFKLNVGEKIGNIVHSSLIFF